MSEIFDWLKPSPLWPAAGLAARPADLFRPQILGFAGDDFMEQFLRDAAAPKPDGLAGRVITADDGTPPKLFQPIHGSFYLVCASLCCRLPGFPDRAVRTADGERTAFVLRKLIDGAEYGWTPDVATGWQSLQGQPRRVLPGEELLPLLPAMTGAGDPIHAGYLPVSGRETYAASPADFPAGEPQPDTRIEQLGSRFSAPAQDTANIPPANPARRAVSVFLVLELYELLKTHLPDVAKAVAANNPSATFSGDRATEQKALLTFLQGQRLGGTPPNHLTLFAALRSVAAKETDLNLPGANPEGLGFGPLYDLPGWSVNHSQLSSRIAAALPPEKPALELPKIDTGAGASYVLRCVYERPQCDPPVQVVSQASLAFTLAPLYDPDAPARAVRIPLPTDVSIAGMRKFKPGVTFMMSNAMRKKMAQVVGKEKTFLSDDPETNPEDSGAVAFVCSFSIQIICIVAFMLLLIFVIVLNIVFWWIAFFKICLPVPKRLLPE